MPYWKMPPKAKVYEAMSAVADGRVKMLNGNTAEVTSSSHTKLYMVKWNDDASAMTSNDNGTTWQEYIGYPMIAVLMELKKITYSPDLATLLAGINWKTLNQQFHNNFEHAAESVLSDLEASGKGRSALEQEASSMYEQLRKFNLQKLE